jgi:hypothetical protein
MRSSSCRIPAAIMRWYSLIDSFQWGAMTGEFSFLSTADIGGISRQHFKFSLACGQEADAGHTSARLPLAYSQALRSAERFLASSMYNALQPFPVVIG